MKLMNLGLHFLVCFSLGGGLRGIRNRARIGCMLQRAIEQRGDRGGVSGCKVESCGEEEEGSGIIERRDQVGEEERVNSKNTHYTGERTQREEKGLKRGIKQELRFPRGRTHSRGSPSAISMAVIPRDH